MFNAFEFSINGSTIKGFPAFLLMDAPFIACVFLGIMIGLAL